MSVAEQPPRHSPAGTTPRVVGNFGAGAWFDPNQTQPTSSPASGEVLAEVGFSSREETDAVIVAAAAAAPAWAETSPQARARTVSQLCQVLDQHREELAELVTVDLGKAYEDALLEVGRGIESVEVAMGTPILAKGESLNGIATGVDVSSFRQPVGVVAAITPFNFPAMIPLWFLPFAVACGNAFVLKPSELDPLVPARIFELIAEHEIFPDGVVNLVNGAHDAVNAILDSPRVDAVSFVGSANTARYVYERAAATGKRVQALGGAKNSLVVMPDAEPSRMAGGVVSSAFGAAGQRCLAGSVAVLVGSAAEQDEASARIVEAAAKLRVGDGLDPEVDYGPLVNVAARERVEREIEQALADGAELLLDGRQGGGRGGAELAPTIIACERRDARAVTEELFGPVLAMVRAEDLDDALSFVNASEYGNAGMIFTSSGAAAREYATRVQAGNIGVNVGIAAPVAWFPFAGWKRSFNGDLHSNGADAVDFYTRKKVVTSRW